MASSREEMKRTIRRLLSGLHEGDLDVIEEHAPPDFVGETVDGSSDESRQEFKRSWKQSVDLFEEMNIEIEWVLVGADRAVAKVHERAIRSDTWSDIPVTKREVSVVVMYEFRLGDGQVTYMRQTLDSRQTMPEAMRYGRGAVLDGMRDGVLALNRHRRVVDVNPAALEMLHATREAVMSENVGDLFDGEIELPDESGTREITYGGRIYHVEASLLTNPADEHIGEVLVFRDSTGRIQRNQQLDVLNRVLRHNLRNDLTVVQGALEVAAEGADERTARILSEAQDQTEELLSLGETARYVQDLLENPNVGRRDLDEVLQSLVQHARTEFPSATITAPGIGITRNSEGVSGPGLPDVTATDTLQQGLWELLENACEHAGDAPEIELDVRELHTTAVVSISDDGPGIPDHERKVLDSREETVLEHGSGLGLWLAKWIILSSDGTLDYESSDGTTARVELQLFDEPADRR